MGHIIGGKEDLGGPVGLEERAEASLPIMGEDVVIRIKHVGCGFRVERLDNLIQGVRCEQVILVGEGKVITLRNTGSNVGVTRNAQVGFQGLEMNAGVSANYVPDTLTKRGRFGHHPRQAQFPVGVGLGEEGVDQGFQLVWVGGVEGGEDGDEGSVWERVCRVVLGFEGEGGGLVVGKPGWIGLGKFVTRWV